MSEVEPTGKRGRLAITSGQNVLEAEKRTSRQHLENKGRENHRYH